MEVKPGYKQTEVGVIPEEWNVDALGEIGRVIRGSSPRPKGDRRFYGGNVPRLMVEDVTRDRKYVTPTIDFLTVEGSKLSRPCKKGTLTVVCSGTPTVVGLPSILAVDACIHDGMLGLVHLSPTVEPEYLFYRLTDLQEQLHAAATHGGTFVNLTTKGFGAFRIAVPPPPEQRAIAEALSDVDGLLGGLDRLIAKKRDLKQAAMQQLLTGQTRLPGFHGEWEVKRLGDFGKCVRGVSYKGDSDLSTHDTPYTKRLLRSNNVQNAVVVTDEVQFVNAARVSSHQILQRDDILICMANGSKALVGKAGIFMVSDGHEYTFGAFMGCFRTNSAEANSAFVFYLFLTARYRDYINNLLAGSSINNLRPSSIESLEFSTPPLPEQTAIAAVLSEMDGELGKLEERREKTRALKQAMMQELLTGRTRLVGRSDGSV